MRKELRYSTSEEISYMEYILRYKFLRIESITSTRPMVIRTPLRTSQHPLLSAYHHWSFIHTKSTYRWKSKFLQTFKQPTTIHTISFTNIFELSFYFTIYFHLNIWFCYCQLPPSPSNSNQQSQYHSPSLTTSIHKRHSFTSSSSSRHANYCHSYNFTDTL